MPDTAALAAELTAAFLDGPWRPTYMAARALEVARLPADLVLGLAEQVVAEHPEPPVAAPEVLEAFIAADPGIRRLGEQGGRVALHRRYLPEPVMAPCRIPAAHGLPVLATPGRLAAWLGVGDDELAALADLQGRTRRGPPERWRFRCHWRGRRLIEAPRGRLKAVQRRILRGLLAGVPVHGAAHGFCRGRSVATHAALHVGREVVLRIDLHSFFPSIRRSRVRGLFGALGYPADVAMLLAGLCTCRTPLPVLRAGPLDARVLYDAPHLPQGAPTSPALANLLCWRLDTRLHARAAASGHAYSRYADDLTFSGPRRGLGALRSAAETIVADEGFVPHPAKTRTMHRSQQQRVTGVVVNDRPGVARRERDRLRAVLHACAVHGPSSQNREAHPDFRAHLQGRLAQVAHLNPAQGERLRALFDRIDWERPP